MKRKTAEISRTKDGSDILKVMRRVCGIHDFLFLARGLTYHIAGHAGLPMAELNEERCEAIISGIVEYKVRSAPYGSRISVGIKESGSRKGLEISFKAMNEHAFKLGREQFLKKIFSDANFSAMPMLKNALSKEKGRLSVNMGGDDTVEFVVFVPAVSSKEKALGNGTIFQYGISIKNIADIRKRFGIKKSHSLVREVEMFVRSLVRHPIDIVSAIHDNGLITVIYEAERGSSQSVPGRISSRLGVEKFYMGKREVPLEFKYVLSALSSAAIISKI